MNKSERLFQLVNILRGRRTAITAEQLSDVMEVSVRTVYRDIQALIASGVPIDGEAGVGYMLRPGYQLPPLMFDFDQLQTLLLGAQMVKAWTDPELAAAAEKAIFKIQAVLPEPLLAQSEHLPYCVPGFYGADALRKLHLQIRKACEAQQIIEIDYIDHHGQASQRCLWPLGMVFWGERWTLLGWCELRDDYRNFRFDRIGKLSLTERYFPKHQLRNLQHYLSAMQCENSSDQPS